MYKYLSNLFSCCLTKIIRSELTKFSKKMSNVYILISKNKKCTVEKAILCLNEWQYLERRNCIWKCIKLLVKVFISFIVWHNMDNILPIYPNSHHQ